MDFTRATEVTPEVSAAVDDAFEYHKWNPDQIVAGSNIRRILAEAVKVIIQSAPPCATRSTAIRKLFEARMDANAAITHGGKL